MNVCVAHTLTGGERKMGAPVRSVFLPGTKLFASSVFDRQTYYTHAQFSVE